MKVENISLKINSINYSNSKFKSLIEANKHLLPTKNKMTLAFDLIGSNEAFANALRRVYNNELLVKALDISVHNINTDDKYILPDNIKERISLIPLEQSVNENTIFNLIVNNTTNDMINIYTKDLVNKNKNDHTVYFNKNILICTLKSNKFINLSSIKINKEFGYNNHAYSIGTHKYKAINTDFTIPSLNNTITDFHIEFTNNANIEMRTLVANIYDTIYMRLKKIQTTINEYIINDNSEDINRINNDIYIIKNNSIKDLNSTDATSTTDIR